MNRGEQFTFACCYKISFSFCIFIEFCFACLKHCSLVMFYEDSSALNAVWLLLLLLFFFFLEFWL